MHFSNFISIYLASDLPIQLTNDLCIILNNYAYASFEWFLDLVFDERVKELLRKQTFILRLFKQEDFG